MKKVGFLIGFFCLFAFTAPPSHAQKACPPIVVKTNIRSGDGKHMTIYFDSYCRVGNTIATTDHNHIYFLTDAQFRKEVARLRQNVLSSAKELAKQWRGNSQSSDFVPIELHLYTSPKSNEQILGVQWLGEKTVYIPHQATQTPELQRILSTFFQGGESFRP